MWREAKITEQGKTVPYKPEDGENGEREFKGHIAKNPNISEDKEKDISNGGWYKLECWEVGGKREKGEKSFWKA